MKWHEYIHTYLQHTFILCIILLIFRIVLTLFMIYTKAPFYCYTTNTTNSCMVLKKKADTVPIHICHRRTHSHRQNVYWIKRAQIKRKNPFLYSFTHTQTHTQRRASNNIRTPVVVVVVVVVIHQTYQYKQYSVLFFFFFGSYFVYSFKILLFDSAPMSSV